MRHEKVHSPVDDKTNRHRRNIRTPKPMSTLMATRLFASLVAPTRSIATCQSIPFRADGQLAETYFCLNCSKLDACAEMYFSRNCSKLDVQLSGSNFSVESPSIC